MAYSMLQMAGYAPASTKEWSKALSMCMPLRLAFICHSGVRSLEAAMRYASLLTETYGRDGAAPQHAVRQVVSVAGGTQAWFKAKRPTNFGSAPGGPAVCADMHQPHPILL